MFLYLVHTLCLHTLTYAFFCNRCIFYRVYHQEVGQFQNRLGRAMQSCQDGARDFLPPGGGGEDPRNVQKAEAHLLSCMERTVDEYIGKLKPLQQRIAEQLKNLK